MATEQNNEELKNMNGEQPKKKKITAVFHKQNSAHNSLKSRPGGAAAPKRPAGTKPGGAVRRPADGRTPVKPGEKRVRPAGERPARPVRPARPADGVQPAEKPAVKAEISAEEKIIRTAAPEADMKTAGTAAPAESISVKPAESPAPAETVKPAAVQTAPAAEKAAAPAEAEKKAEPEKAPEPEKKPVRRFVDMEQVRAAERAEKNRAERARAGVSRGGARGAAGGQSRDGRSADRRPGAGRGPAGAGRPGERPARPGQGTGGRPGERSGRPQGAGAWTGRGPAGAGRPGERPARPAGGDFGGMGVAKPGAKSGPKNKNAGNRFNRKDSDELRRPGGKGKGGNLRELSRPAKPEKKEPQEPQIKMIVLPEVLTIRELAEKMKINPSVIVKKLFLQGKIVTVNQEIDYETASDIAVEFDVLTEQEEKVDVIEELLKDTTEENEEKMVTRPPVVCVMGHVDHGKTSLLDAIRKTNITAREAGGITQAIGASVVEINGQKITFLDTPGHEAFTAMRMRGAQATDIAILVVAADDGVMPQTVEAINHAKAAGVEVIVAVNKIDKPGANVDRVMQELTEHGLVSEEWGGTNIFVPVSAKTGEGIDTLLESILLVAEVAELKADPDRLARGIVIEAELDKGRGPVATVLVQKGTLHVGDSVAAGACYGKIRAMIDDKGRRVTTAGPSDPVEILGLGDVPNAGEIFVATETEKEARAFAETFIAEGKKKLLDDTKARLSLDDLFSQIKAGNVKELNLIIKADVQGSVEAVKQSLTKLSNDEVVVKVIHGGVGAINESDVSLASASNAIIIGFNVRPDPMAKSIAEREQVDVRLYKVIYQAIEDVEAAMKGMLDPVFEERVLGHAVVRQTFKASGVGTIAGAYVLDGKITRGCKCRVRRGEEELFDGDLVSLKRFKDDVKEVLTGYECGLVFDKFNDLQEDDTVEAYDMVQVERT